MLGGRIHRSCERCILPGNTGDVEDVLGLFVIAEAEEVRDCELGGADWVGDIDVDQAVTASGKNVFARRCAGRTPEVTPMLLWSALDFFVVRGSFIDIPVRRHQLRDRRGRFLQIPSLRLRTSGPAATNRSRLFAGRLPWPFQIAPRAFRQWLAPRDGGQGLQ